MAQVLRRGGAAPSAMPTTRAPQVLRRGGAQPAQPFGPMEAVRALSSLSLGAPAAANRAIQTGVVRATQTPSFQEVAPALGAIVRRPAEMLRLPTGLTSGFLPGTKAGDVARGIERQSQDIALAGLADELALGAVGAGLKRGAQLLRRGGQAVRRGVEVRGAITPEILPAEPGRPLAPSVPETPRTTYPMALRPSEPRIIRQGGAPPPIAPASPEVGSTTGMSPKTPRRAHVDQLTGLPKNADGTVTLYHHTSAANAAEIRRTGILRSAGEPDVYFTTEATPTTGYGDAVVPLRVNPKQLHLDDEFPSGRKDFRMSVGQSGGQMRVRLEAARGAGQPLKAVAASRAQAIRMVTEELRQVQRAMAEESGSLFKRIRDEGGITEEIRTAVPKSLLRKEGRKIDELAEALGFSGSNELLNAIATVKTTPAMKLAQLRAEAAKLVDSQAGTRLVDALQTKGFTEGAMKRMVRDLTRQTQAELAKGSKQAQQLITTAEKKALTPAQLGRMARLQRVEPGATVLGPQGATKEAPLSDADVRRVDATVEQIVPRRDAPTGTPPIIPRDRSLMVADVPKPDRDLNAFQSTPLSGLDTSRAAELVDGRPNGPPQRHVLEPLRRRELAMRQEQQGTLHELRDLSGNLKEGSDESRMVFEYLEGRLPAASMTPRALTTAQWMAQQFDALLARVNQARQSIGKRPILRRTGYITHLQDQSLWEAMREAFTNVPADATKTLETAFYESLRARGPGFRFGLPRQGGPTATDAIRAFKAYLPAALRVIHLSEPSRLATVYVNRSLAGTPNAHRYFSQLIRQVATGEQGPIAKLLPGPVLRASNWLKGRFGKGTILGNLSSVLQQPFTLPATIAQTGPEASTAAAGWLARGDGMRFAMQWSPTLQARVMEMDVDFTRLSSKWDAAMGAMFAAADRTMVAHAFNAGYLAAVKRGATFEAAIQAGEQAALRTQSSFLTSDMAPVFRDTFTSGFLQFQNTINGVFNFLKFDIPRSQDPLKAAAAFVGTFAAMVALYEALGLPHPDDISDFVPGLSTVRSGGPVGIRLLASLSHLGSPDPRKQAEAIKALQGTGMAVAFGAGGNQLRKSFEGFKAVASGGKVDKAGRQQFPVEGLTEQARAVAFGPYGTKAGQAYVRRGFKAEPLTRTERRLRQLKARATRGSP